MQHVKLFVPLRPTESHYYRSCGGGQRGRHRDCLLTSERTGSNPYGCEGETDETEGCEDQPCPVFTQEGINYFPSDWRFQSNRKYLEFLSN